MNNYYPTYPNYQPYQYSQANQQTTPQIQNGGFIPVRNIDEARNYPVAPGNSVTFKDETLPYVYTKTMSFSQLDRPIFEKYRLVKEEDFTQAEQPQVNVIQEIEILKKDIKSIKEQIKGVEECETRSEA